MRILKQILTPITICCFLMPSFSQSDKITFKIPGKYDLFYDGERLDIAAPNLSIGLGTGENLSIGLANTLLGQQAGGKLTSQTNNTFIGYQAGGNSEASGNVFIGYQAGINESRNNRLFIANSSTSEPLIHGNFGTKTLTVNNNLFVTSDLYLPSYVSQNTVNLVLDDDGKVTTQEIPPVEAIRTNIYSFEVDRTFSTTYNIARFGVNIPDGTVLGGIKAIMLDNNDNSDQGGNIRLSNTIYVQLKRKHKFDDSINPEQIYLLRSELTPEDTYVADQVLDISLECNSTCNVVDNDTYVYFYEIFFCKDCDFVEVSLLE